MLPHKIGLPSLSLCGEVNLTASSGTILSPNYPENYPYSTLCEWWIEVDKDMVRFFILAIVHCHRSFNWYKDQQVGTCDQADRESWQIILRKKQNMVLLYVNCATRNCTYLVKGLCICNRTTAISHYAHHEPKPSVYFKYTSGSERLLVTYTTTHVTTI